MGWYGTLFFTNTVEYMPNEFITTHQKMYDWPTGKYCSRVWWRGVNGRWSLLSDMFNIGRFEFDNGGTDD
jgi:hypothetical protein